MWNGTPRDDASAGERRDVVHDAVRIVGGRADDERGVVVDQRFGAFDTSARWSSASGMCFELELEVLGPLGEGRVGRVRDHDRRLLDAALLLRAVARDAHGLQDRLRAAGRHRPGRIGRRVEQPRRHRDDFLLHRVERRELERVQRVLEQVEVVRVVQDLVDVGAGGVDEAPRLAAAPVGVAGLVARASARAARRAVCRSSAGRRREASRE